VWAAPDSGFFYADDASYPEWQGWLLSIVAMSNATSGLDSSCVAALIAAGRNPAECSFPEIVAPYITTPLFVMQGRYDPVLASTSSGESGKNVSHVNAIGRHLIDLLSNTVLKKKENAAFITACAEHCGQWSQGVDGDFNVTISGQPAIPFLLQWRAGNAAGKSLLQAPGDTYPCAKCCYGGSMDLSM
jgi:Pectinacetylesterase